MKKKLLTLSIFIATTLGVYAQELPIYNQYLQNFYYLSPAAVGWKPCTEIIATDRHQWTGIKNAPNTQAVGIYTRLDIFDQQRQGTYEGLGLNFYNDNNGANSTKRLYLSFAHHFKVFKIKQEVYTLSLSMAASGFQYKLDETNLNTAQANDPLFTGAVSSAFLLNFDASALLYSNYFAAGLTVARLRPQSKVSFYDTPYILKRIFTGFVSYRFKTNKMRIEPAIALKTSLNTTQIDLSSKFYFADNMFGGIAYRHSLDKIPGQPLSTQFMFGYKFGVYTFGYAYEYTLGKIGRYNFGSHDVMVSVRFCKHNKHKCPAYQQNPHYRE